MILQVDCREQQLIGLLRPLVDAEEGVSMETASLPVGDIIVLNDDRQELVIIERKTIADLLSSIKDGRYEEQRYRLSNLGHVHHHIMYLIEGYVGHHQSILYAAMTSLHYFSGFSIMRTQSCEDTATFLLHYARKLHKERSTRVPFYSADGESSASAAATSSSVPYTHVVKRVKKDNLSPENMTEVMLSQIPGVSPVTAHAIVATLGHMDTLIATLQSRPSALQEVAYTNDKGQRRTLTKPCMEKILQCLLPTRVQP